MSREELIGQLWPKNADPLMKIWAIVDCARDTRIYGALDRSYQERCCLFAGTLGPALAVVAPQLVHLDRGDRLTDYILDTGWGNAWGIFLRSSASIETLRRHFRKFLRVRDPSGRHLLFRYYDPRVLSVYLPTCLPEELNTVFGMEVDAYLVETGNGGALVEYEFDGRRLKQEERKSLRASR